MLSKRDPVLSSNSVNNGFLLYIAIISSDQFVLLKQRNKEATAELISIDCNITFN